MMDDWESPVVEIAKKKLCLSKSIAERAQPLFQEYALFKLRMKQIDDGSDQYLGEMEAIRRILEEDEKRLIELLRSIDIDV